MFTQHDSSGMACPVCDTPFAGVPWDIEYSFRLKAFICASGHHCMERAGIDQEEDLGKAYVERVTRTRELTPEDQEMIRLMINQDPRRRPAPKPPIVKADNDDF